MEPFDHLLFFAAWPMLAACIALFLLREHDTLWAADEVLRGGMEREPSRTGAGEAGAAPVGR